MSTETLEVAKRDGVGSTAAKKLRNAGRIPAVLYGHGEENVNLSLKTDAITRLIFAGSKLVDLTGDLTESALVSDVQWDSFGSEVIHVDLTRVSKTESIEVAVPIEVHGEAPGTKQGGMLQFVTHEVTISCAASALPEHIQVNVGQLGMNAAILASELTLPAGATLLSPGTDMIVQVTQPSGVAAESTPADAVAEPEVIGRGGDEAESNDGE